MSYPRQDQVQQFVQFVQDQVINPHYATHFPYADVPQLSVDPGRRYARIVRNESHGRRSVYGFIDLDNGDILKAEGWRKPALHARGSLDDPESWAKAAEPYGIVYLR